MIGHLGSRISALLDGQLPAEEAERAWAHVHSCHVCRDAVEREGWVKTRLAGLSGDPVGVPDHLKGSLLGGTSLPTAGRPGHHQGRPRRIAVAALGGSAAGAAVLGVVALGLAGPDAPAPDRAPATNLGGLDRSQPPVAPVPGPVLRPTSAGPSR